ncbi:Asp-tRNA(Asn)/Glu-tRNA(Gln) amidotransferase subunit GatB [Patescibacteria group bacterium]
MKENRTNLLPIIGIEVHVELATKSKMFCGCSAWHFKVKPNTHTCPVCLGLPGALPVPNKKAVDWCLLVGLALDCKINKESKFDRKNYFYPDLAKGYQISQYDMPFCKNGKLKIDHDKEEKTIRINRVHMEEDTGKLIHKQVDGKESTLVDFNRSGVPLMEIVTEPDINSSSQAVSYLKKLQQLIRFIGVSDCDMEKGSMRCEINVSLSSNLKLPKYKVEVKNINSFKFVSKVIEYEIQRQKKILLAGKIPDQETRGFSEKKGITVSQRSKEEAHDYRYFPEPDIPPINFTEKEICKLRQTLPELPEVKKQRFIKKYKLSDYEANILTTNQKKANYIDNLFKLIKPEDFAKMAKLIINKKVDIEKLKPDELAAFVKKNQTSKVSDEKIIGEIINKVMQENKEAVLDYKNGKTEVLGFLIGQVMKETQGKADIKIAKKILQEALAK